MVLGWHVAGMVLVLQVAKAFGFDYLATLKFYYKAKVRHVASVASCQTKHSRVLTFR